MAIKKAILKTKLENEIIDLMVKTETSNIVLEDGTTTLASKLAEIVASVASKAEKEHTHTVASATVDGFMSKEHFTKLQGVEVGANKTTVDNALSDTSLNPVQNKVIKSALDELPTNTEMQSAISAAIDELIAGAPGTYDTLKEIADYLSTHETEYTALVQTVGGKVDKATYDAFVNSLGTLAKKSVVTETDLDAALKEKVNAAAEGNHSHSNKEVLDGISADKVVEWDSKPNVHMQSSQPENLKENDLWFQILS